MSLNLHIFKQEFNYNLQTDHTDIHLIQIGKTIHEEDLIDVILDGCRRNWHLEGECGFEGEIEGEDLIDILKEFRGTDSTDPFEIDENDIYRVTLSY